MTVVSNVSEAEWRNVRERGGSATGIRETGRLRMGILGLRAEDNALGLGLASAVTFGLYRRVSHGLHSLACRRVAQPFHLRIP
jgi:hypothetical protein